MLTTVTIVKGKLTVICKDVVNVDGIYVKLVELADVIFMDIDKRVIGRFLWPHPGHIFLIFTHSIVILLAQF